MPVGLSLPLGVSTSGGARLVDSDENDDKIIKLALGSDDNENAFNQDIGLGSDMIFDNSTPAMRGGIVGKIRRIFAKFEAQKRYRLMSNTVKWTEDTENQELKLKFKYLNLESDEPKEFSQTIKSGNR